MTPTHTRSRSALGAYVALQVCLLSAASFVAHRVRTVATQPRGEAGFSEITVNVAMAAIGVLAVIAGFTVLRPVIAAIINKIQDDVLNAN